METEHEREAHVRLQASVRRDEDERDSDLERGARVAREHGDLRRAHVVRIAPVHEPPDRAEADERVVARHHADDGGEVVIQLRDTRPEPERGVDRLRARDERLRQRIAGEKEDHERGPVVLAARREEERLVEQAEDDEEDREVEDVVDVDACKRRAHGSRRPRSSRRRGRR